MGALRFLDAMVDKILKVSIVFITIIVVTSMTLQVCGRYFLPLPFYGLDELTGHTAVWFYMLGAAYSAYRSDHIKADMLEVFKVPDKVKYFISLFASLVSITVSGFLIVWSYRYLIWSIGRHEVTPSLHIPTSYFQVAILVGSILLFVYFIKEFAKRIFHKQPFVADEYESQVANTPQ
jgi:TRAP-type C4-dicarboxylate transport system permease small subunit